MAREPKKIPARDMIPQVAVAMQKLGFRRVHRSPSGSIYLGYPGMPFQIRLSDHRWSVYNTTRQAQVVKSVVLQPVPASELPTTALILAIGFLIRVDVRKGALGKKRDGVPAA